MTQTTNVPVTSPATDLTSFLLNMAVNKKENGEYKLLGNVEVPVFCLADFGVKGVEVKEKDKEGLPVYDNPQIQFVQDAVTSAIKAIARNKLVSGTAITKSGSKIASTVAELLESTGNSAAALQLHRDFVAAFLAYLPTSGKSVAAQNVYSGMIKAKNSIAIASEARRNGLVIQLENFMISLNEEDQARFMPVAEGISTLCESAEELSDDDL